MRKKGLVQSAVDDQYGSAKFPRECIQEGVKCIQGYTTGGVNSGGIQRGVNCGGMYKVIQDGVNSGGIHEGQSHALLMVMYSGLEPLSFLKFSSIAE